jgi:hypothetical protein
VGRGDGAGVRPVVARRQVPDRDIPAPAKASLFFKVLNFQEGQALGQFFIRYRYSYA